MDDPLGSTSSLLAPRSGFTPGGQNQLCPTAPVRRGRVQATKDRDHAIQDQKRTNLAEKRQGCGLS